MSLELTLAKKMVRLGRRGKSLFPELFGNKNRLYFPLISPTEKSETQNQIESVLLTSGYSVIDYVGGYCVPIKRDGNNNKILGTQKTRIGKVLNKLQLLSLLENFKTDGNRSEETLVALCRHPYDLAGMSTGRNWSSCMSFPNGSYNGYVRNDILGGTLIAYHIKKSDKNINVPLSRLLIKPYVSDKGYIYMQPANKTYGLHNKRFKDTVKLIAETRLNSNLPEDIYKFDGTLHYNDDEKPVVDIRSNETKDRQELEISRRKYRAAKREFDEWSPYFKKGILSKASPFDLFSLSRFVDELFEFKEITNDLYDRYCRFYQGAYVDLSQFWILDCIKDHFSLNDKDTLKLFKIYNPNNYYTYDRWLSGVELAMRVGPREVFNMSRKEHSSCGAGSVRTSKNSIESNIISHISNVIINDLDQLVADGFNIQTLPIALRYVTAADSACRFEEFEKAILSIKDESIRVLVASNYVTHYGNRIGKENEMEWVLDSQWNAVKRAAGHYDYPTTIDAGWQEVRPYGDYRNYRNNMIDDNPVGLNPVGLNGN